MQSWTRWLSLGLGLVLCVGLLAVGITREVPLGVLQGVALMAENRQPLAKASISLRPVLPPAPGETYRETDPDRRWYSLETGADGRFAIRNMQAGEYELSITGAAHVLDSRLIEVKEGASPPETFAIAPSEPFLDLYAAQRVMAPGDEAELSAHGFGEGAELEMIVHRIDHTKLLAHESIYHTLSPLASSRWKARTGNPADVGTEVKRVRSGIQTRDAEGVFHERLAIPGLEEGLYWVQCKLGGMERGTWFTVSKLSLTIKQIDGRAEVFAVDIDSGKAVPGVELLALRNGQPATLARTNVVGLAKIDARAAGLTSRVLMGRSGKSVAFVDLSVDSADAGGTVIYCYTERPVYRPGDEVMFKGVIRQLKGSDYAPPTGGQASIEVRDEAGQLVSKGTAPVSGMGTFHGSFTTNPESRPGDYSVKITHGKESQQIFVPISAYRKPEFSITVEPERPFYLRGDIVRMRVSCTYYHGGPVQNATIRAVVNRAPTWDWGPIGEDMEVYEGSYGGEYVTELEVTTDSSGRAWVEFDSSVDAAHREQYESTDIVYEVTASVDDGSGKYFDGTGSVKVLRGEIGVSVEPERWVADPNVAFDATIRVYDPITKEPVAQRSVMVETGYAVWDGKTESFQPFDRVPVVTNRLGLAAVSVKGYRAGELRIRARATDNRGRGVEAANSVWIAGGASYGMPPTEGNNLMVRVDKPRYRPGDTATLLIQTAKPGGTAWITTEADGIYTSQAVPLTEGATRVRVKLDERHAPNAYVSVVYVRDRAFSEAQRRLNVDLGRKDLRISIRSDRAKAQPGETVHYTIRTTDLQNRPRAAEVSFGIVDESIYAIMKDSTDIAAAFYPKRYNAVETSYSFEEIYLDGGDKAPKNIEIRKRFKDTAYWNPIVQTGPDGLARLSVELPDNLTTWRATAVGVTADTSVGMAVQTIQASKPLMVRLQAPSFFVGGDTQRLVAQVTNDSGRDAQVHIDLAVQNGAVSGERKATVNLRQGATHTFEWPVRLERSGLFVATAKTWIDSKTHDGVELSVPVHPNGVLLRETSAGTVRQAADLRFQIRDDADIASGRAIVRFEPSLASSMALSLDELIDYPYGCVEQTMSRFVPLLAVNQAMQTGGLRPPARAAEIPKMLSVGLTRLRQMQHENGSWGWWSYDEPNEWMTGYVLEGLALARATGAEVDPRVVRHAMEWGLGRLGTPFDNNPPEYTVGSASAMKAWRKERLSHRVQLLLGLARHGGSAAVREALLSLPEMSDAATLANAAMAAQALGMQAETLEWVAKLKETGARSEGMLTWPDDYGVEAAARAGMAIEGLDAHDPDLERIVRGMMHQRRGHSWWSTRDTAAALMFLSRIWSRSGELVQSGTVRVLANGVEVGRFDVPEGVYEHPDWVVRIPFDKLKKGENVIRIEAPNFGSGFYTLDLRQTVAEPPAVQLPGIRIHRAYYPLSSAAMEDGALRVLPGERPSTTYRQGDLVKVVLTLDTETARQYTMLEDPIPSGTRIQNQGPLDAGAEWNFWWSDEAALDDRMTFFVTDLTPGTHTFVYVIRAESPGQMTARAPSVSNMYDPDRRAHGLAESFTIEARR